MNWSESSEIVTGLILDGRLSINAVYPSLFIEPYDKIISLKQKNPEMPIEELIAQVGFSPVDASLRAAERLNGLGDRDWVKILENSALIYTAGARMQKISQRMMQGETPDLTHLKGLLIEMEEQNTADFVRMSDIKEESLPFIPTGWEAFDNHTGGIPEVGMIILGGLPGSGKTTAIGRFAGSFVKKYKDKNVALFSLEMRATEVVPRIRNMMASAGTPLTQEEESRVIVSEKPFNAPEIIGRCCKIENLGLVIVDFIDWAIEGEINEPAMTLAYNQFAKAAKTLRIPFIIVAQLNDLVGMPKPRNIRWSRLAWGLAWMILMIYDPSVNWSNDTKEEVELPIVEGSAYIIVWKSRGGFRIHPDESPGAILVPFDGRRGWHPKSSKWYSLKKVV